MERKFDQLHLPRLFTLGHALGVVTLGQAFSVVTKGGPLAAGCSEPPGFFTTTPALLRSSTSWGLSMHSIHASVCTPVDVHHTECRGCRKMNKAEPCSHCPCYEEQSLLPAIRMAGSSHFLGLGPANYTLPAHVLSGRLRPGRMISYVLKCLLSSCHKNDPA